MSEWQPIETAPKDGSRIIIFWNDEVTQGFWMNREGIGDGKRQNWVRDHFGLSLPKQTTAPTHWMPLPPPPTKD